MNDKQQIPASVRFQATGELDPIDYNWVYIIHICRDTVEAGKKYVVLPVQVPQTYKPQRRRLIQDDKSSPRGLVLREPPVLQRYYPYAPARFEVEELAKYAAKMFNELSVEAAEQMVQEISNAQQQ